MSEQTAWRFCNRCNALFFNGFFPNTGACPAGGGHAVQGFDFALPFDVPETATAQGGWRFCNRCNALFFNGFFPNTGACPAGGGHAAQGLDFRLPHDVPVTGTSQSSWRFCTRCNTLFFDGFPAKGVCPAGGGHTPQGSVFVLPHHGDPADRTPLNVWVDSLRCHSETPGFGIGESDEPFVVLGVIDLERTTTIGVPATETILYGPLSDVDDQENHTFPFRPFWSRPLTPRSAVFVAALLEHDNVNPDVTRTAAALAVQAVAAATVGAPVDRIGREAVSAVSAAVEPASAPGVVNRLIGPPTVVEFGPADIALAVSGQDARRVHRFSGFGDYSVHFLARRA